MDNPAPRNKVAYDRDRYASLTSSYMHARVQTPTHTTHMERH